MRNAASDSVDEEENKTKVQMQTSLKKINCFLLIELTTYKH
jgi:hypothetical protein